MTILLDARRNVSIDDDAPTALDRDWAAMTSPYRDEAHDLDAPTPDDLLVDTTDHDDDDQGEAPALSPRVRPRYEVRVMNAEASDGGYCVWDAEGRRPVRFCRWFKDADDLAIDLNAEDFEDQGAWWATMPPDADLDARWCLTLAGGRSSAMNLDASEDSERFA